MTPTSETVGLLLEALREISCIALSASHHEPEQGLQAICSVADAAIEQAESGGA